jgi:hypothetical protein
MPKGAKGGSSSSSQQPFVPSPQEIAGKSASGGLSVEGSHLMPVSTIRREMTYVLLESQFDNIARLNASSLLCFNIASICFGVFTGTTLGWLYAGELSDPVKYVTKILSYVSGAVTIVLVIFGIVFWYQKGSDLKKLKKNTEVREVSLEP